MEESSSISVGDLLEAVRKQVEYYFSKENLQSDRYLVSIMDANKAVDISAIMNFAKLKALTTDEQVLIKALEASSVCVVEGGKIRATANVKSAMRSTLILRDIPSDAHVDEVREIFNFQNCRAISSLHSDIGDTWFVIFDNEDDAADTLLNLKLQGRTFRGQSVKGRVKSEPNVRSFFPVQAMPMPMQFPGPIPPYPPFMGPPFGFPNMVPPNGSMPIQFSDIDTSAMTKAIQSVSVSPVSVPIAPGNVSNKTSQSPSAANGQTSAPGKAARNSSGNQASSRAGNSAGTSKGGSKDQGKSTGASASSGSAPGNNATSGSDKRKKGSTPKAGKEGDPGFDSSLLNFPPLHDGPVPAVPSPKPAKTASTKSSAQESASEKQHADIQHVTTEKMRELSLERPGEAEHAKAKGTASVSTQKSAARANTDPVAKPIESVEPALSKSSWAALVVSGNMTTPADSAALKTTKKPVLVEKSTSTSSPSNAATVPSTTPERKSAGSDEKKTSYGSRGRDKETDSGGRKLPQNSGGTKKKEEGQDSQEGEEVIVTPSSWGGRPTFANIMKMGQQTQTSRSGAAASENDREKGAAWRKDVVSQTGGEP